MKLNVFVLSDSNEFDTGGTGRRTTPRRLTLSPRFIDEDEKVCVHPTKCREKKKCVLVLSNTHIHLMNVCEVSQIFYTHNPHTHRKGFIGSVNPSLSLQLSYYRDEPEFMQIVMIDSKGVLNLEILPER